MAKTFYVSPGRTNQRRQHDLVSIGDKLSYSVDFKAWAEQNAAVTTVTWTVESGNASVSGQSVSSSVATATIDFADAGRSLISVRGETAGGLKKTMWLDFMAADEENPTDDYGLS